MADSELKEILTDYKNLTECEHHSFVNNLVNNPSFASTVFAALQIFEDRPKSNELLQILCDLLFNTYRRDPQWRHFSLQFVPHLTNLFLINYGDKQQVESIETWLVAINNIELEPKPTDKFRIPNLSQNSIYHDSSQIHDARGSSSLPEMVSERGNFVERAPNQQVKSINSQNKQKVIAHLFSIYCSYLGEYDKQALEAACKVSSRMVSRGLTVNHKKSHKRNTSYGSESGGIRSPRQLTTRLPLASPVLLEMLQIAYFALHNGCVNSGLSLAKDIEFRGRRECLASVLLVSRAVLQLIPKSSGVEEQPRYISTPTQLSKNMITNASFRAKKLEGDIPRVEEGENNGPPSLDASRMSAIVEEADDKEDSRKAAKDGENIADKIKARMENVRMMRKKDRDRTMSIDHDMEKGKLLDKKDRRKERKEKKETSVSDSDGGEEIRMQNLPSQTIAIHSPESGSTSIF